MPTKVSFFGFQEVSNQKERYRSSLKRCLKGKKPKQEIELGLKMARFQLSRFDQVAAVGVMVTSVWSLSLLL